MVSWPDVTPMRTCTAPVGLYDTIERPRTAGFCPHPAQEQVRVKIGDYFVDVCEEHAVHGEVSGELERNPERTKLTEVPLRCNQRFCGGGMRMTRTVGLYIEWACTTCGRKQYQETA